MIYYGVIRFTNLISRRVYITTMIAIRKTNIDENNNHVIVFTACEGDTEKAALKSLLNGENYLIYMLTFPKIRTADGLLIPDDEVAVDALLRSALNFAMNNGAKSAVLTVENEILECIFNCKTVKITNPVIPSIEIFFESSKCSKNIAI